MEKLQSPARDIHPDTRNGLHPVTLLNRNNLTLLDTGTSAEQFLQQKISNNIAQGHQDAFYVADLGDIKQKHWRFMKELPRVKPFYAVKCNSTNEVLQMLATLGTGFDCASMGEIDMVLRMGVPAADIVYANPCKQVSHIKYAAAHGVCKMTFDCEAELFKIAAFHPKAEMILRIATDDRDAWCALSSKYGALVEQCEDLLKTAKNLNIQVIGVSFHTGSGCKNTHSFCKAIEDARKVFEIGKKLGYQMRLLDIGGGFSGNSEFRPTFEEFADVIRQSLNQYFPNNKEVEIISEPGRYYVESAFTVALNIITKKEVYEKGADGNSRRKFSYILNDGVYGTFLDFYLVKEKQKLKPLLGKDFATEQELFPSNLWGPTCTNVDKLVNEFYLPELETGDWVIFPNMGAYSISMSTTFNGFPQPKVYFVLSKGDE
ncbi:ornithine decarboxylase-like isoform X1 [Xenopus tropicalis]|uniref:Ornithine decarboxylase-like n=2 Tax=Xenopus tropicalis TaxID=8364 RepID=A0A803KA71_XENTR|nr:ornithine decarboxylase-like isoform X1 [Xenopus tropicalis]